MAKTVNMSKLLAKIAAVTNTDVEELEEKRKVGSLYSFEETIYEVQSVISYYKTRIQPKPPKKKSDESNLEFAKRQREYEQAYNQWRFKKCEGCKLPFAYAYTYDGVKFCSLDCMNDELRKIGLSVTPGRPLHLRWGRHVPAIVPSSAFETLESLRETDASSSDADEQLSQPLHLDGQEVESTG